MVSVLWMLSGFSIAFSDGGMVKGGYGGRAFFGSLAHGALRGVTTRRLASGATYPMSVQVVYQLTFAIITVGLSGLCGWTGDAGHAHRQRHGSGALHAAAMLMATFRRGN